MKNCRSAVSEYGKRCFGRGIVLAQRQRPNSGNAMQSYASHNRWGQGGLCFATFPFDGNAVVRLNRLCFKETYMMRHFTWLVAATLSVGGMAFMGCEKTNSTANNSGKDMTGRDNTAAADNKVINNKTDAARTAGEQIAGDQIGALDLNSIYNAVEEPVKAAFKHGKLDNVADYFTKADHDRIGKLDNRNDELKGSADTFTKSWKGKYNDGFDVGDKEMANWLQVQKSGETKDVTMANAMIPAGHGLPAVTIPLVKDGLKWRIDVPDTVDGTKVWNTVKNQVYTVGNSHDKLPADQIEARRYVVHSFYVELFDMK